jgi:predicted dehydrogenase
MTASPDDQQPIRLGVIGAGRIAQVAHLPAIEKAAGVTLVGVSDPSPTLSAGVAARYGVGAFTETGVLLEQDIDAVIIATPDRLHHPLGMLAMEAGKHVLMEKPLAATSAEARALADAAATRGLVLQTGAMKRHDPGLAFARRHMPRIGQVLSFTTWYRLMGVLRASIEATLFPELIVDQDVRQFEDSFKAERETYLLATHGAHLFDGLVAFAGMPEWVSARAAHIGPDYTWHGLAGLGSGGLVSFEISAQVHGDWSEGMEIYGEFGHISTRTHLPFFKRASDVNVYIEADGVSLVPHFGDTNAFKLQVESFADAVRTGRAPDPTPDESVMAVRLIEAVGESSREGGREVRL